MSNNQTLEDGQQKQAKRISWIGNLIGPLPAPVTELYLPDSLMPIYDVTKINSSHNEPYLTSKENTDGSAGARGHTSKIKTSHSTPSFRYIDSSEQDGSSMNVKELSSVSETTKTDVSTGVRGHTSKIKKSSSTPSFRWKMDNTILYLPESMMPINDVTIINSSHNEPYFTPKEDTDGSASARGHTSKIKTSHSTPLFRYYDTSEQDGNSMNASELSNVSENTTTDDIKGNSANLGVLQYNMFGNKRRKSVSDLETNMDRFKGVELDHSEFISFFSSGRGY